MRYHVQRKGGFELLCIAICDAHHRFLYYDTSHEARSHDSLAWKGSALGAKIDSEGREPRHALPDGFFLNGDAAFICTSSMVTPMKDSDFDFY